jgi:hypothetical protein
MDLWNTQSMIATDSEDLTSAPHALTTSLTRALERLSFQVIAYGDGDVDSGPGSPWVEISGHQLSVRMRLESLLTEFLESTPAARMQIIDINDGRSFVLTPNASAYDNPTPWHASLTDAERATLTSQIDMYRCDMRAFYRFVLETGVSLNRLQTSE